MALVAGSPAVVTSMLILWLGDYTPRLQWTLTALILGVWLGFCFALRERVASPLRTLANLLEAMREGDYSIRARHSKTGDAIVDLLLNLARERNKTLLVVTHDARLAARGDRELHIADGVLQ